MNVCFVTDEFYPSYGGVGINAQILSYELTKRGHKVIVITARLKNQPEFERKNGVHIYRTRSLTLPVTKCVFSVAQRKTIQKIMVDNEVDIIHFHVTSILAKNAYEVAKQLKLPKVFTLNTLPEHFDYIVPFGRIIRSYVQRSIIKLCNKSDAVISPSPKLIKELRRIEVSSPIYCISNAVGFETFKTITRTKDKNTFIVFYAGRLSKEKNLLCLLDAFSYLEKKCPNSELWFAGQGPMLNRLRRRSARLSIKEKVKFLGFVPHDELSNYYHAADVFVLPSLFETQGMVAIEAMYFSKPIVCTSCIVSADELVEDGRNGFLIEPNDTRNLADKLALLNTNKKLRHEMGCQSKIRSENFDTGRIVNQLEALYKELRNEKKENH